MRLRVHSDSDGHAVPSAIVELLGSAICHHFSIWMLNVSTVECMKISLL